jgi:SAM-dependent methyltransferase
VLLGRGVEFFRLLGLSILVFFKNAVESGRIVARYYSNKQFRKVDCAFIQKYLFKNPFRISKNFSLERGAVDVYTYGETPLTTMQLIADACEIQEEDTVFELGCGRGRTCFWLSIFKRCHVVGIELIPEFVEIAQHIKKEQHLQRVCFLQEDMLKSDLSKASVIYLYGTCYEADFIHRLIKKFEKLPIGTRVITVSYSLAEFGATRYFLERVFSVPFTWGEGDVYLQVRR